MMHDVMLRRTPQAHALRGYQLIALSDSITEMICDLVASYTVSSVINAGHARHLKKLRALCWDETFVLKVKGRYMHTFILRKCKKNAIKLSRA